jgi:hypothetical protein
MLTTAISGSFNKFKKEIDALHYEFLDHGVEVIAPPLWWLWIPSRRLSLQPDFRPLPVERHMPSIKAIEDEFLERLKQADFHYVYNAEQYIGGSTALELGASLAWRKLIFLKEPFDPDPVEFGLEWRREILEAIHISTPAEAARQAREALGRD